MRFEGFVGNDYAKAQIAASVDSGHFPHALLIEGPVGSGRKTLARLIATAAVCTAEEKPCGQCAACIKAKTGHPDITVVQGDGSAKSMNVALIRELREQAAVVPNEADHKVVIFADADCMNVQAQNALLKILEEPPSYMIFILTATSRTKFLPTIQSRCVSVSLSGVSEQEAVAELMRRDPTQDAEALLSRVRLYGGCIGTVLSGQEDAVFNHTVSIIENMATAITGAGELTLMKATAPLEKDKPLTDAVLYGLQMVVRDAMIASKGATNFISVAPAAAKKLAATLTESHLMALIDAIEELIKARTRNMNQTLLITLLCARLRAAAGR